MPGPYRFIATVVQSWKHEFIEEDFENYFADNGIEPADGEDWSDDQRDEALDVMKEEFEESIADDISMIPQSATFDVELERLWPSDETK